MGDPSISGLTNEDINFKAPDTNRDADTLISEDKRLESKKDQVIKSILSGKMPSTSDLPLASHPDLNRLGTHILRIIYPKLTDRPEKISKETLIDLLDKKKSLYHNLSTE